MTTNDNLRKEVKLEIQSLLCTEKAAIPSRRLYGLYMSVIGSPIPYLKLGFKNMDDLLKSMPDVVYSHTNATDGLLYVKAVPLEASSHIIELVRGQRTSKLKKKQNSGYLLNSKFRGFRVSSQIAPSRNFNKNYNSLKPHEKFDNMKTGSVLRQTVYSVPDNNFNLPPRFMQLNQQSSLLGVPPSTSQPNYSLNSQTELFHSMSHVASNNNYNMNNDMNQIFMKQQNLVDSKTSVLHPSGSSNSTQVLQPQGFPGHGHMTPQLMQPRTLVIPEPNSGENKALVAPLSVSSNSTPVNKPQGLPGVAHMTPQLMQPRTLVVPEPNLGENKVLVAPLSVTSNCTPVNKPQGLPGRSKMIPQLMQPRTPVHQAQPETAESHVFPNPHIGQLSNINPIQKSLANLNITLKLEESKSMERDFSARQLNSSTSQSQQFSSPSENKITNSNYFQWKQVEPKPVLVSVKHGSQQFYAPGVVQPAATRQVCILAEEEPKHVQESLTPGFQQCKSPGVIQSLTFDRPSTLAAAEPSVLLEPRPILQIEPATPRLGPKLPEFVLQEPCTPQKIIPSARAPRMLLKNGLPIVRPSTSLRPLVYRPDNTAESVPAALPSTPTPRLPPSPSPLLSRRLPYRSSELHSVPQAEVNNVTPRPFARPTAPSDRLAEFYCERLKTLVTTHNLGKVTLNHNQLKTGRFIASIKVGQDMFITYPKDFENLTDAYEDAAEQAVNHFVATPI